ncbi:SDR family NAD(P)-dependent oxidoreductase [Pseudomonas gingeri]|uniref:SDR family NAD(P)-dependent oxidoreductase n=1 Tax=Pseudomonas gingeri TaxID=117681 RepID=UPI00159FDE03|nr:SDR family NAD(P)-dependent oxidoreductase [Pseudomonas gingeri]NWA01742.1 SDR family NAD(P)-dependent oxidoreductase [Pseudomonas gingeri]NWA12841.1 SDR family NAD(P)-dependent oxidoreductase [Pseudomonas gingeri]NWA57583.1 SDR family NAD(P)-dependent oxidoreductase [Pseudomonas gingeri]NWA93212.1 SDR family NAD(P)-dependent oxidoreductase [Pseudomonas gingeri]NWB03428.1 SDR family NAD(P)-dependent oxidoreductase [Pseudomonas gingeri]
MTEKTALIVGASRGLGLALAEEYCSRGYQVIATSRGPSSGLQALKVRYAGQLQLESLDMVDLAAVRQLRGRLGDRPLRTLFINAGICKANELTPLKVDEQDFIDMMLTNALSPMRVVEVFHDTVEHNGVIVVMSSELGSIANNAGNWALYSSSKAALNMLMKAFAARHPHDPRALLLMAPGWVRTEMGGPNAILEIPQSIPLVVDCVERHAGLPGLRFTDRHGETLPW